MKSFVSYFFPMLCLLAGTCNSPENKSAVMKNFNLQKGESVRIEALSTTFKSAIGSVPDSILQIEGDSLRGLEVGDFQLTAGSDTLTIRVRENLSDELFKVSDRSTPGGFSGNIEGPALGPDGRIYLVNFERDGTIGRLDENSLPELFVTLPQGSTANGLRFDAEENLFAADFTGHNILKINIKTKEVSVFYHNDKMNQPNDVAIDDAGRLYASDPKWADGTGQIWRINPDGAGLLLDGNCGTTNGIEVSPDNTKLYVNESVQRKIWVYDLDSAGNISDKKLFAEFPDYGFDGMRCDSAGNLFVCRWGKGTVAVFSPEGELLREVEMRGKKTSNIAFGGPEGKICFVTLQDRKCVESFRTDIPGRAFVMRKNRK